MEEEMVSKQKRIEEKLKQMQKEYEKKERKLKCLLDEANRENTNSEFSLPKDFSEEFKRLQLAAENKISEAPLQTEGSYDTAAQCVNEDIEMKEFKLLHPIEENSTDDAELGLNEKTECKEEAKRKQSQQLEIFHEEYTDTSLTESTAVQFNMNSTSEMQVQVNYVLEEGDQANLVSQSFENNSCMSPPLFESQPDKCLTDTDADSKDADTESDTHSSPQVTLRGMKEGCRASPAGTAVLPENQEESGQTEGLSLEQTHIFQVPKSDQLVSLVMGETKEKLHIVCLCSANLRFNHLQNNQWFCYHIEKLGFLVKKNSGCSIILVPDSGSRLCVVLQQRKTDSVKLTLYVSGDTGVNSYHVDSLWSRSVLLCPSMQGEFIASYVTDQKTYLTKYTLTDNRDVQRQNFDPILDEITSLCSIRDQEAILGLSVTSQLYVWNSKQVSLLSTVDVSDVSLQDMMCSHAFYEEGFLFLTVFSKRKCRQAGSMLVVNPQIGTCETLTALETRNQKWTGYSTAVLVQDENIIVRENCGSLSIWDLYTGKLVSTLKETNVSCVASACHSVALCHKHCVHVYNIEDSGD